MAASAAITVRKARSAEWQALRDLRLRALGTDPLAFGSTLADETTFDEARWRKRAADASESATTSQWVAEDPDGRLVGSSVVAEAEGKLYVFGMWVDPQYRGQGVGARLLDAGLTWASAAFPGRSVHLDVNPRQTAAIRLYESRGFRRSADDRPLGHTPGETRYEMTRKPP
jgi:ribosomal protein S18 acetylase RimI-like enzyme